MCMLHNHIHALQVHSIYPTSVHACEIAQIQATCATNLVYLSPTLNNKCEAINTFTLEQI